MSTRPNGRSSIRWRTASAASDSGKTLLIVGCSLPSFRNSKRVAFAAATVCWAKSPKVNPRIVAAFQMMSVTLTSGIAGSDHSATKGERRERLTSQFSADAVDDDIDALAFGDPHNTLLEAFPGEVDHMIISSRASLVCLFGAAGSRDR